MSYKDNPNNYTRCEKCKHIDRENVKCKITNDNWLVSDRAGTCHQFEGVESMKVRCIDNEGFENELELGKIYTVPGQDVYGFKPILISKGDIKCFSSWRFEEVKDETKNPILAAKEFEENVKKGAEMLVKCSMSGEELFNNPIRPNHYQAGEFDVIAFCFKYNLDFASGNVVKYIVRTGKKDKNKELEDLLKAKEYLERKIEWVKENA